MKQTWYNNDWFLSFAFWASLVVSAVGNYFINGGRIVW